MPQGVLMRCCSENFRRECLPSFGRIAKVEFGLGMMNRSRPGSESQRHPGNHD